MRTVLTNSTIVDCVQPIAVAGAAVVIEDGRIREIRTDGSTPEPGGGPAIDLRGAYLMPGLWDVHIHPDYYLPAEMPLADQVALFGHRLIAALQGRFDGRAGADIVAEVLASMPAPVEHEAAAGS